MKAVLFGFTSLCLFFSSSLMARETVQVQIIKLKGKSFVIRDKQESKLTSKSQLLVGDIIKTTKRSFVRLKVHNSILTIAPNSYLRVEQQHEKSPSVGQLLYGHLYTKFLKGTKGVRKIKTPTAVMGVRGTTILLHVTRDRIEYQERVAGKVHDIPTFEQLLKLTENRRAYSQICCIEGKVDVETKGKKKVSLTEGQIIHYQSTGTRYNLSKYPKESIQKTADKLGLRFE